MFAVKVIAIFALGATLSLSEVIKMPENANMHPGIIGADHDKVYLTVTAPNVVAPPAIIQQGAPAQPSIVQNAGTDEPTVTVTETSGAVSAKLSLGAVALVGSFLLSSYY